MTVKYDIDYALVMIINESVKDVKLIIPYEIYEGMDSSEIRYLENCDSENFFLMVNEWENFIREEYGSNYEARMNTPAKNLSDLDYSFEEEEGEENYSKIIGEENQKQPIKEIEYKKQKNIMTVPIEEISYDSDKLFEEGLL